MRLIFGLVSLLVMLAAVALLAKKSLVPVQVLPVSLPDVSKNAALPAARPVTTGSAQQSQALQQVQQQLQQTMDVAAQTRPLSEEK